MAIGYMGPDGQFICASADTPIPMGGGGGSSIALTGTSTDVANSQLSVDLAAAVGKLTSIAGFAVTGTGAVAAGVADVTITGLLGQQLNFVVPIPAGVDVGITPLVVEFNPPIPSYADDADITVICTAFGAGNIHSCLSVWGTQK
jgi:hypothetical protein